MAASKDKAVVQVARQSGKSTLPWTHLSTLLKDVLHKDMARLIISTGTVFGQEYHSVEPVGGDWVGIIEWCYTTYGDPSDPKFEAGGRWYTERRTIWFRDQKDRDWFVLRWNS